MGFAGELATIGLPEVLSNLACSRLSGVLSIHGAGFDATLLLDGGIIRAFCTGNGRAFDYETIAEVSGAAPADVIDSVRGRSQPAMLREALADNDAFCEATFNKGVHAAVQEELLLLFDNPDASFRFDEGPADRRAFDAEQLASGMAIHADELAAEAARRRDDWHDIGNHIGSLAEVFIAEPDAAVDATPEMAAILQRLDGTRDLRTALDALPHERLYLMQLVAQMIQDGVVKPASADHLRDFALQCAKEGEINRAVVFLEHAMARSDDVVGLQRELTELFESTGRLGDAADSYMRLAELEVSRGAPTSAVDSYAQVIRLRPHDVEPQERIVAIHEARGDHEAMALAARQLAGTHAAQGRDVESLAVLRDLLRRDPQDIGLREAIAATYIKLHEPGNAAEELLGLAESATTGGELQRALHYYRSVLAVDRSCDVAAVRIEEIESMRGKRKRRTRRRRMAAAVITLLVTLGAWQGTRELFAQQALNAAAQASAGRGASEALTHYAGIHASYPMTRGAVRAEEIMRVVLLHELRRIRETDDADAMLRLGRIDLPDAIKDLWRASRDR